MKVRILLLVAAGICCMGASRPGIGAVEPYFGEHYEEMQAVARQYEQKYHEGIKITGTSGYIARIRAALDLIEAKDSRNWYFVRKNIRRITLNGHSGIDIGGGRMTSAAGESEALETLAGGIVHEAWHRELYLMGRPWQGREAEVFCLRKQNEVLGKLNSAQLDLDEMLRSEYWKVDYWSRQW
jgi:hypothetical protein